jgi:protein-tyrosine phosphatase
MTTNDGFSDITTYLAVGKARTHGGPTLKQLKEDHDVGALVDLNEVKSEAKDAKKIGLKYIGKRVPLVPTAADLEFLSQAIDQEVKAGRKVYVHCHKGIYRGPTVAVAYLIYKGMKTDDAIKKMKDHRPSALPDIEHSQRLLPRIREFESTIPK